MLWNDLFWFSVFTFVLHFYLFGVQGGLERGGGGREVLLYLTQSINFQQARALNEL